MFPDLSHPPGAALCPLPLFCASASAGTRALLPDARSGDHDGQDADAEVLAKRACGR